MEEPRTAKACGSGTRGWCQADGDLPGPTGCRQVANPSATEAKGIRLRGERAISRKTIAQGRPGVPAHLAVTRVHFVRTIAGAEGTRLSLRPLRFSRASQIASLGRLAPRECEGVSSCRMGGAKRNPSGEQSDAAIDGYRFAPPILRLGSRG